MAGVDRSNTEMDCEPKSSTRAKKRPLSNLKFNKEWMHEEEYKQWLQPVKNDPEKAQCSVCNEVFTSELTILKSHGDSLNHKNNVLSKQKSKPYSLRSGGSSDELENQEMDAVQKAQLAFDSFVAKHKIPPVAADHLVLILQQCFHDSQIVQQLKKKGAEGTPEEQGMKCSCKR